LRYHGKQSPGVLIIIAQLKFKEGRKMRNYQKYLDRKNRESKFDPSDLAKQFIPYYESGQRIEVEFDGWGEEDKIQRGYVGVTTGWKPAFILVRKVNSLGSDMILREKDKILKAIPGKYRN
jgi:hypothetical protein